MSSDIYYRTELTSGVCPDENSNSELVTVNLNPTAASSVSATNTTICAGASIDLSYTGGSGATFEWYTSSCGGTSAGTGNNLTVSPTSTTTYYGRWENSCGNSTCQSVTVNVDAMPTVYAGSPQSITTGTSTTLNGTVTGGTSPTYTWTPSASISGSNAILNPSTTNLTSTTVYTLSVVAGACSASDQVTITVTGGSLTVSPSANPTTICAGSSSTLAANAGGGSGTYTYSWTSSPAGFSSTLPNPTVSPTITTIYTVTVDDGSTTTSNPVTVNVNPLAVAPTSVSATNTTICAGASIDLSYTGGLGSTFEWYTASCGGTSVGTGNNLTISPTTTTTYYGRWENSCGNSTCESVTITVNPVAVAPTSVNATNTAICEGTSTDLVYAGGSGSSFEWYTASCGGTSVGTGNNLTISPTTTTTYYGRWENSCGNSNCESVTVIVNANATASFSYIQNGLDVDFTSLATNANSWDWNFGDGNSDVIANPSHTYASYGTYNVTLTVNNANGCGPDSDTQAIDLIVSVESNNISDFVNVYPNPNNGQFEVKVVSNENEEISINLYNVSGQIIYSDKLSKTAGEFTHKVDVSSIAKGLYNVQIIRNNNVTNKTVIIR